MEIPNTIRQLWPRMALAIGLGLACGLIAAQTAMPLPWMLGPMLGCGAAALLGAPVHAPAVLRRPVVTVIGVMLGSAFHSDMLAQIPGWAGTFLLLPPFMLVAGWGTFLFFRHVAAYDARTAFFCAAPGGLNEMVLMAAERGANERNVALAHAVRIFVTISAVAFFFAVFLDARAVQGGAAHVAFADLSPFDMGVLLSCAVLGAVAGVRLRLPAGELLGPMVASALVHVTGIVTLPPPTLLVNAAQVVIGTILGCRFVGASVRRTGRDLVMAAGATLTMLSVTVAFAALSHLLTGTPTSQAALAFSPGGLTEMSLIALAMGQDVAFVATVHVTRIVIVLFATVPLFALLGARMAGPKGTDRDD